MTRNQSRSAIMAASGVLHFQDPASWRSLTGWSSVVFNVFTDRDEITCVVSQEYLEDTFGDAEDFLSCAQDHADEITDKIGVMIARGLFEPDGSVVLRSISR